VEIDIFTWAVSVRTQILSEKLMNPHAVPNRQNVKKPRVLYIAYWSILDGMRDHQAVLPPIASLARCGVELALMTFEKPEYLKVRRNRADMRRTLKKQNIRWVMGYYHKTPTVPATAFDVLQGCVRGLVAGTMFRPQIIHARTIVGGLMGLILAPLLRAKLVYHQEGFYPDEQVDAGLWEHGSLKHRIAHYLERRLLLRAHGILTLSHRARNVIESIPEIRATRTPVEVTPSVVNIEPFLSVRAAAAEGNAVHFVYIGAVGGRYELEKMARFVAIARQKMGSAHMRVLSYVDAAEVELLLKNSGLSPEEWSADSVPHSEIPVELAQQQVGLFFLRRGISEHACSPTKIGEYWASGLPVVVSAGVSDTDDIIRDERVGVIVENHSDLCYLTAASELKLLLADPELPERCRQAAKRYYSVELGVETQLELYRRVLAN
jgi:glycosyltransferase involved in cell wall biosynthesis